MWDVTGTLCKNEILQRREGPTPRTEHIDHIDNIDRIDDLE